MTQHDIMAIWAICSVCQCMSVYVIRHTSYVSHFKQTQCSTTEEAGAETQTPIDSNLSKEILIKTGALNHAPQP